MRLASFLVALALGVGVPGIGDLAVPAKTVHAVTAGVTLTVAPDNSGVLRPGEDLVLSGTISNGTGSTIDSDTASVYLDRSILGTRSSLSDWLNQNSDDTAHAGVRVLTGTTPIVLAGESRSFSLTIPAAAIGIGTSSSTWGARALSLSITSGETEVASAKSSIVWYPGASFQQTKLAIAVPITLPATASGLIGADALTEYTAPDGILTQQLDAAIDRRVAIAVDPMIIGSIRILGNTAPPTARAWLDQLKAATNDTFALSYADSDISLSSQAGQNIPTPTSFTIDPKLYPAEPTTPTPTGTTNPTDGASDDATVTPPPPTEPDVPTSETLLDWDYTMTGLAWPRDDSVVAKDLGTFAADGLTTTILSSSNASYGDLGYTPSASAIIDKHPVLISDSVISALLRKAVLAPTQLEWRSAMAELSASVAVVTRERPGQARTMLATLGRDYPTNSPRLGDTLDALANIPWLSTTTLSTAAATTPITAQVTDKAQDAKRVSQAESLFDAEHQVGIFSSVLEDPTLLTGPQRLDLLATMSNAWISNPAGWASAFSQYLKKSTTIITSVKIVDSSKIFQPADNVNLPVTVRNDLDFPVDVIVNVRSPRNILKVVDSRVALTIEPNSQSGAHIAVQSVANGDVTVSVSISSSTGAWTSAPSFVEVNVQAGWETAITVVIAVLIVGVFGFGIWRNISKRRKAKAKRLADDDAEPDDTAPATATTDADESRG